MGEARFGVVGLIREEVSEQGVSVAGRALGDVEPSVVGVFARPECADLADRYNGVLKISEYKSQAIFSRIEFSSG